GGRGEPRLVLDRIDRGDPIQRLFGNRRFGGLPDVVKLPPGVRPASNLRDRARLGPSRIVQPLEASVAVSLKEAGEARHVRRRMLGTTVGAVEIGRRRSGRATKQPIVAHIDPQPSGRGPPEPRRQHRHRGVVAVDLLAREDMLADLRHHRVEQPGGLTYPVTQRRAVEFKSLAGKYLTLTVQRKVVTVLRHQQMCQGGGGGATARGRHRRSRCLRNRIAGGAGIFWPDVADHPEVAGHVIQNLGHVLAELGHPLAAVGAFAGAVIGGLMHDLLARRMVRQRLALRLAALADRSHRFGGIGLSFGFRGGFGLAGFQFLKPQFELLDLAGDALRRAAFRAVIPKPRSPSWWRLVSLLKRTTNYDPHQAENTNRFPANSGTKCWPVQIRSATKCAIVPI